MDTAAEGGSHFLAAQVFCANQERQKKRKAEQKKRKRQKKEPGIPLGNSRLLYSLHLTRFELAAPGVGGQCSIH